MVHRVREFGIRFYLRHAVPSYCSSPSISVPDNDIDQNEENEPRSPLSASHMQQMQLELAVLDDTRRRVRAARVLRVQTEKAQNVQGLEQIDRKIEETEKLLSSLREQKHELLNDQKALGTQQTTLDVDVNSNRELAIAIQAVRRAQAQESQMLRNIQSNTEKKRPRIRLSQNPEDSDTIVVSSPVPR